VPGKVKLEVVEGAMKGQKFTFEDRDSCIVGRQEECGIKLPSDDDHSTISRYHCLLDINPPDIRIRDFGSMNGTFVNGKKIGQREKGVRAEEARQQAFPEHDLKDGDEIKLGNTVFKVSLQMPPPPNDAEKRRPAIDVASAEPAEIIRKLLDLAKSGRDELLAIQCYSIEKELGRGGFGAVYLAKNNKTGERVALKVMLPQVALQPGSQETFEREIENSKMLSHPNVVQMRDYGCSEGTFFFAMEFCDHGDIDSIMENCGGTLDIDEATGILFEVLDGLEYAHNVKVLSKLRSGETKEFRGLVHRDLKPSNIFLKSENGSSVAKVADYGLAKAFDTAGLSGQTRTGTAAGTPVFMPRQQVVNFKYAKPDVDVWAAAASLYYMLTRRFPRDFKPGKDSWQTVLQTKPVSIRNRDSSVPKRLADVIDQALDDSGKLNFQTAAEFKKALQKAL
jgi:pSer/pThr/pTyr-binding forkhead associated (FHA) protein